MLDKYSKIIKSVAKRELQKNNKEYCSKYFEAQNKLLKKGTFD